MNMFNAVPGSLATIKSEPYWWEDAGTPVSPPLQPWPDEVEVLVIGAGLTGLSAARTLARAGKSVLVVDSSTPGSGASSRNGGMFGGGHRLSIEVMEAKFGHDTAHRLLREASLDAPDFAHSLMLENNIACDYQETGRFRALWRKSEYESVAKDLTKLQKIIPVEAEMLPASRQNEEVASDIYAGGTLYHRHGGLNPAKWVAGLMNAAVNAGSVIQGDSAVTAIEKQGRHFRITTARGPLRAGTVLVATNGYTPQVFSDLKRRIIPVPSFIITTEKLGREHIDQLIPNGRMIVESRERHCYFRPSSDRSRIVFGGRAAMFDAPETFALREMKKLLAQVFPGLKGVNITHSWRGLTGFSFDFQPHVGQADGIWHAIAFSGSGNAMAPYLGHKAALQILGDAQGETAFSKTDLPTRWWHQGNPWFLPFADLTFRGRDLVNNLRKSI